MILTLDELLSLACKRTLQTDELDCLCDLAIQEGRVQEALVRLITSRTVAGRINIMAAKRITSFEGPRPKVRRDRLPYAAEHSQGFPFSVTNHAIEQFSHRHLMNDSSRLEVIRILQLEAASARPMRERTNSGQEQWVSQSGVLFVMKRDGDKKRPTCVTILPKEAYQSKA